jgi:hypothetical protein
VGPSILKEQLVEVRASVLFVSLFTYQLVEEDESPSGSARLGGDDDESLAAGESEEL